MWFYLQRSTFSGKPLSGWRHGKRRSGAAAWTNAITLLVDVANRLSKVLIASARYESFRDLLLFQ